MKRMIIWIKNPVLVSSLRSWGLDFTEKHDYNLVSLFLPQTI